MKRALLLVAVACSGAPAEEPIELRWERDEATAFARARCEGRGVLFDPFVKWSVPSDELSRSLEDPSIAMHIAPHFVPWRADVSDGIPADLEARYRTEESYPHLILLEADSTVIARIKGYVETDELARLIEAAAAKRKR